MRIILPAALALSLAVGLAWAENTPATRVSLKGLEGVALLVEPVDAHAQQDGLSPREIHALAQSQLEKAKIRVLSPQQQQQLPRKPCLRISLATSKLGTGEYLYSIQVDVVQWVASLANPAVSVGSALPMPARTWSAAHVFGIAPAAQMKRDAHDAVRAMVDEFIDAYHKANPSDTARSGVGARAG